MVMITDTIEKCCYPLHTNLVNPLTRHVVFHCSVTCLGTCIHSAVETAAKM